MMKPRKLPPSHGIVASDAIKLVPGDNVRYCIPHSLSTGHAHKIFLRCKEPMRPCEIRIGDLMSKRLSFVVPAEMIMFEIKPDALEGFQGDTLRIDIRPRDKKRRRGAP